MAFTQIFRFTCQYCGQIPWLFTIANPNLIYAPSGGTGSGASTGGVCSDFVPHDTTSSHAVCGSSSTTCIANPTPAQAAAGQCGKAYYNPSITNTLLTQVDGSGSGGYPARDQTGTSADQGANHTQVGGADPSYIFNNTNPNAGGAKIYSAVVNNDSPLLADNRDYYDEQSASGNGSTVGVGVGVLASRSATCTTGVGYWATDQSVLYTCGPTNTWNVHYTPLVHPHPLQGGGAPIPTWTPSIYAFGGVLTTNTATKSINLQNTGSIPLNISITMSGSSTFTQTNTCGLTLAIGASCTVVVQFAPTSVTSFTGTLTETDSVNSVSSSVALSGSGVSAIPAVSWTPSTYNFGNVTTGSTPSSTFTLQNTGVGVLNVSLSVTGSATFTNPSTTCGATLTAGATCTATVQFAPVAGGTVTGSLVETDTPNGVTGSAALTGTGASAGTAQIQITPATTLFNPNKTQTVTVTNIGGATETLATPFYVFSGANAADFSVTGGTCSNGGTITASSTCTVVVQWSPTTGLDEVGVLAVNGTASTTGNLKGIPVAYPGTFILF